MRRVLVALFTLLLAVPARAEVSEPRRHGEEETRVVEGSVLPDRLWTAGKLMDG